MIKNLIKLADRLDANGFKKEADIIDGIIETFASEDDLLPEEIEDINKLMRGWDTGKEYDFPRLDDSTTELPPSRFVGDGLARADVWYTYNINMLDEYDKPIYVPDTIESMHDVGKRGSNLCALIAFPEGFDFLLEFDRNYSMSSEVNAESKELYSSLLEISSGIKRDDVIKYGLLVTNEQFNAYASEHGFKWHPSKP